MSKFGKLQKRTSKAIPKKKAKRKPRQEILDHNDDLGFLTSTDLEIESRKIEYGCYDRHREY